MEEDDRGGKGGGKLKGDSDLMETTEVGCNNSLKQAQNEEEVELRRGPWTAEEDFILVNYIEGHGEGRWNSLARCSGLKRTGKSCRLRWLNYLRPDVRRGNITPEEQLLILELHSRYGNRWSKIAQHLPGRTDNEIKNYWRTRVQKHAKQLNCDVGSRRFQDVIRYLWMPRLLERIRAPASDGRSGVPADARGLPPCPESSSSDSVVTAFSSPPAPGGEINTGGDHHLMQLGEVAEFGNGVQSTGGYWNRGVSDFEQWDMGGNLWNVEDVWL